MYVIPDQLILTDRLRAVFPMQDRVPFGITDFVGEYGASSIPQIGNDGRVYSANDGVQTPNVGNLACDPLRQVIYARPLFVPHSQIYSPAGCSDGYGYHADTFDALGLPTLKWWNLKASTAAFALSSPTDDGAAYTGLRVDFADNTPGPAGGPPPNANKTGDFVMDGCAPRCFGFKAFLRLGQPVTPDVGAACYTAARWRVTGSQRPPRWYSIGFRAGQGIAFGYNDSVDGAGDPVPNTWANVDSIRMGGDAGAVLLTTAGETDLPMLDVRLLAGQMTVSIGSEDTPYPWPHMGADESGTHDWFIDSFQVAAGAASSLRWEFHPTKFATACGYVSTETNVGYVPEAAQFSDTRYIVHTEPHYADKATGQVLPRPVDDPATGTTTQVGFLPPGSTVKGTGYDVNGDLIRYLLTLKNTKTGTYKGADFADFTACVRAVSLDIPGVVAPQPPSTLVVLGQGGGIPNPETFTITHSFDLGRLCISRSCSMTFNNFAALWTNGDGLGVVDSRGHFAVEVQCGMRGGPALQIEFIGVGNRRFTNNWQGGGNDKLTLFCEDQWCMLDVPSWNLPWFDGWNVYSVLAYLAGLGTITCSMLAFAPHVPDNPYDLSPGLPDAEQFFMPIGVAGTPLTRFSGGQHLKDIMLKISQSLGCIMYFDQFGRLNFEKFRTPGPGAPVRIFSHADGDPLTGAPGGLQSIWGGSYSGGMEEVRNSVTVIGVNAYGPIWNPKVSHDIDTDSIYNDDAPNFIGWNSPVVWTDNLFVDQGFADKARQSLLAYLRIPDRQVGFSTWYQPDGGVHPGDMIRVITPRSGAAGYTFFVTQTSVTFAKGQASRCDIQARLVPQGS